MEPLLLRLGNEIRQGLHHILGLLELTSEEGLSQSQLDHLDSCREAADQLLRAAADLTELGRPVSQSSAGVEFNPARAVEEICGLMRVLAGRKGLALDWVLDSHFSARVVGDKYLLQDMLRRLLDNSIRFTESGSIRLFASRFGISHEDTALLFEIVDTGVGMSQEEMEDSAADASQPRLQGLSLRVLRRRLAEGKGSIAIEPNSPQGTIVRVKLPVSLSSAGHEEVSTIPHVSSCSPLRVLLAEDSEDSFLIFKAFVKAAGHQITRALDGVEAVDMAKKGDFDFIMMDVNMPRLDGYSATCQIREWETAQGRARLPIVLLSADDLHRQARLGGAAGCSGYLTKPISKAKVLSALAYFAHPAVEGSYRNTH